MAEPVFDPTKPFETINAPTFEPSKPFEAVALPAPTPGTLGGIGAPRGAMTSGPGVTRLTVTPTLPPEGPPQEEPAQQNIGPVGATALGALQGGTFNFGDELAGLGGGLAASTPLALAKASNALLHPADRFADLGKLVYESVIGKNQSKTEQPVGDVTAAFNEARDRWTATVRRANEQAQEQHPNAYLGGNIAGSLAGLPLGGAIGAPVRAVGAIAPRLLSRAGLRELGARTLGSSATGAITGGLSGVGEGADLESRAMQGGIGTVVGGAIGAAAPPVIEAARAVPAVARGIGSRVRSVFAPSAEAERRIVRAKQADIAADPNAQNRMTDAEAVAAHAQGEPVMQLDTGIPEGGVGGLARSAANQSPQARAVLAQKLTQRSQEAPVRYSDRLQQMLRYTPQQRDRAIREVADQVYEPRYARAWKDARHTELWDPTLEELAQAPEVQNAIRVANSRFRNWAALDGFPIQQRDTLNVFKLEPGRTSLVESKSGASERFPSLQRWDYIKRALDQSGDPTAAMFARALRDHLDTLVPSYKAAREAASHIKFFEGASNAYEAGQTFVNKGVQFGPEARARLAAMDPREQNLFRDGYLHAVVDRIEKTGRLDAITRIQRSRGAREEMTAALGPQGFNEVEGMVRLHDLMERANKAVQGNSTTARQIIEYGLASGSGGYGLFTGDPTAIAAATALAGRRAVNDRMARRIADLLVQDNPAAFANAAQLLSRDQRMLDRLRSLGATIASKAIPPQATRLLTDQRQNQPTSQ